MSLLRPEAAGGACAERTDPADEDEIGRSGLVHPLAVLQPSVEAQAREE
jgi:hypothetical protein